MKTLLPLIAATLFGCGPELSSEPGAGVNAPHWCAQLSCRSAPLAGYFYECHGWDLPAQLGTIPAECPVADGDCPATFATADGPVGSVTVEVRAGIVTFKDYPGPARGMKVTPDFTACRTP